jgi:hypothetical protein
MGPGRIAAPSVRLVKARLKGSNGEQPAAEATG